MFQCIAFLGYMMYDALKYDTFNKFVQIWDKYCNIKLKITILSVSMIDFFVMEL